MRPQYAMWQVTAILNQGKWAWYVLYIPWCYLDWEKWNAVFSERNKRCAEARFCILIVNEHTKDLFLTAVERYRVETNVLRAMLEKETDADGKLDYEPTIFIDFDTNRFISFYPEMAMPECYVPDGWTGSYADFSSEVPEDMRYWISEDGRNLLKEE